MYIAICDDHREELDRVAAMLTRWKSEKKAPLRYRLFSDASALLDAAQDETAEIVFLPSSPGFAYESYGVRALYKEVQEQYMTLLFAGGEA